MTSAVANRPRAVRRAPVLAVTTPRDVEVKDARHCPPSFTSEAVAVLLAAAEHHARAEVWGMHSLATIAHKSTEAGWDTPLPRSADQLSDASNELDGALAIIDLVNDDAFDCMLMHAARSLLMAAKLMVDDEHARLMRQPVGATS